MTLSTRSREPSSGPLAPAAFVVMWASGAIAVTAGLAHTSVVTFLLLRALGATVLAWAVWLAVRDQLPRTSGEWLRLGLVAVLFQVGYQSFFFLALDNRLPAGILAVIVGFQPVLTALISRPGRDYRLWTGLVIGIAGVAMTVSASLHLNATRIGGLVFATLALAAITIGTVIQGNTKEVGLWSSLALQSTFSSLVFVVIAIPSGQLRADGHPTFYLSVAWMVLVVSVGATALLYFMVNRSEATRVASLFYCVPPVAALLDWLIIGRTLTVWEILGLSTVVLAIVLIQMSKSPGARSHGRDPRHAPAR